jgi:hypothetical protein
LGLVSSIAAGLASPCRTANVAITARRAFS